MFSIFPNGWLHYLSGGLIIGVGVSIIYLFLGRVAGISTFYSSTLSFISNKSFFHQSIYLNTRVWRSFYALGLILGASLWMHFFGSTEAARTSISPIKLLFGGILIGFGSRLSNGCTSGHGICGISSLSLASFVAVIVFMTTAILTANLIY
jgi:uncharacterized membrane protein YedE/YeeE